MISGIYKIRIFSLPVSNNHHGWPQWVLSLRATDDGGNLWAAMFSARPTRKQIRQFIKTTTTRRLEGFYDQ